MAIWPRGGGKSTGAEAAAVEFGAHAGRRYCWYVRETQENSDKSVQNIADLLESKEVKYYYPGLSDRAVGKYGASKGWRRARLVTSQGYTIDAMGLDKATRGVKQVEARPDIIILDDIDSRHDSPKTTEKKIEIITQNIIPAGSPDVIVLFIQNLIVPDGVMSQLVDGRAEFLLRRKVSGPYVAVDGLTYKQDAAGHYTVTGGTPTWPQGQGLSVVEEQINTMGPTAFLREAQHEVNRTGGFYDHIEFNHIDFNDVPPLTRVAVWVDPAVTSTDKSDCMAIQADGLGPNGKIYRLYSFEQITTPEDILRRAILKAHELGAVSVGVETDQGGDTWRSVYARVIQGLIKEGLLISTHIGQPGQPDYRPADIIPGFKDDKAGAGHGSKVHRGLQMLADYERGTIVHVRGTHGALEKALMRFPNKPLDLADAAYWAWHDLRNRPAASGLISFISNN